MQVDPSRILVLDIAGPALQPVEYTPLMLRKPDPRRQLTQTWRFTEDGRLCCGHNNVFVQAKDGFYGVRQGELLTFFQNLNSCSSSKSPLFQSCISGQSYNAWRMCT